MLIYKCGTCTYSLTIGNDGIPISFAFQIFNPLFQLQIVVIQIKHRSCSSQGNKHGDHLEKITRLEISLIWMNFEVSYSDLSFLRWNLELSPKCIERIQTLQKAPNGTGSSLRLRLWCRYMMGIFIISIIFIGQVVSLYFIGSFRFFRKWWKSFSWK